MSLISSGLLIISRCILSLSFVLSCLDDIKDYYLSLSPRLRVPVSSLVCAPWQKTRPNRKRRPFTLFCFGKEVAARHPALACVRLPWEFGGIAASAASPLATSPHARRSREISHDIDRVRSGSPKPAGGLPSSRVAAPPGVPFAGDHATGPPLTQCPPDRLWLSARRIGADSCPLAAAYPSPVESPHVTARSAVCLFCCAHRNILITLSCHVHGDLSGAGGSSCCGHGGHSSRLPPCRGSGSGSWGNLVRAPDVLSCPEEASAS